MTTRTDTPHELTVAARRFLTGPASQLRVDSIRCSTAAGSGHPTSAMSAADLMAVMPARHLHYEWGNSNQPGNDHLISKEHVSPLLYAMLKAAGAITGEELVTGFRQFGSQRQGHPTPGAALGRRGHRHWAALRGRDRAGRAAPGQDAPPGMGAVGDSEMAEGSMREALDKAAYYKLGKVTAIIDVTRPGQRGRTELGWNMAAYRIAPRRSAALPSSSTGTTSPSSTRPWPPAAGISASRIASAARELLED
jgi:transketolase